MCFASATRTIVATALLGAMLGGCSEYYFDRRDGVTLHSGESMAANRVTQWPRANTERPDGRSTGLWPTLESLGPHAGA